MSRLKKSLLVCLTTILSFAFLISPFNGTTKKQVSAATNDTSIIDKNLLNYVTISVAGKTIEPENVKTIDTNEDNVLDTSYIIANNSATINFEPLKYNYYITLSNSDNFILEEKPLTFTLDKDGKAGTFEHNEKTYNYAISTDDEVSITGGTTTTAIKNNGLVKYNKDTGVLTIYSSYTLKGKAGNSSLSFRTEAAESAKTYTINFERPIVNMHTNKVTLFTCTGLDIGNTPVTTPTLEDELSYENVKLKFTNNNYTETNPLYFDINHNGFIYTFTLFSKEINGTEYLFVEYYDEQKEDNKQSLATKLNSNGDVTTEVFKMNGDTFNMFSIDFNKTGRYEISVYDSSYLLLKDEEDNSITQKSVSSNETSNYNFYYESFYIKNNDSTAFDNAYVIMQSYDDDGNYIDYIVSEARERRTDTNGSTSIVTPTPTLNTSVQIRVKNLLYYFENDEVLKNLNLTEESDDLQVVEFIKTTLAGSTNLPVSTYYTISELKELLEKDPDFTINCSDDAFYEVIIKKFEKTSDSYRITHTHTYQFTIVKQPKISFTVFSVDENNNPIIENGEAKKTIHEATVPFVKDSKNYKINITSSMDMSTFWDLHPDTITTSLNKTYLNEYTIDYAMQSVKMEEVTLDDNDENADYLNIRFYGIGEIKVTVSVNSATTTYTVKSGQMLTFQNYGTYSIAIEDSMGTVGTAVFPFEKPVSTSAIIMIVLVGIIAVAIVLFIIASRGKVKTR